MKWSRYLTLSFLLLAVLALAGSTFAQPAVLASPVALDYYLYPEVRVSLPEAEEDWRYTSSVTYNPNHDEYLVVWHNYWHPGSTSNDFYDIYARRLTASGQLLNQFVVASGYSTPDGLKRYSPAAAFNPITNEYLVVYVLDVAGLETEVWGRRISWDGLTLYPEFQIFTFPNREFGHPRVVRNSFRNTYFVVAHARDTSTDKFNDVCGRLVMANGSTPYAGHNISTQSQVNQPMNPDVAYMYYNDEYFVVWAQYWNGDDMDIFGARVNGLTGDVIATDIPLDWVGYHQDYPVVASNDLDRYLVAWTEIQGTWPSLYTDVYAAEYNLAASRVGNLLHLGYTSDNEAMPAVTINKLTGQRFVTFEYYGFSSNYIMGFSWYPTSTLTWILPFPIVQAAGNLQAVAAGGANFLVAYDKTMSYDYHIYATLYTPFAVFLPLVRR